MDTSNLLVGSETSVELWPNPERGPWRLSTLFVPVGGRLELCGLTLEPADVTRPMALSSTVLRHLVPSRLTARHRVGMERAFNVLANEAGLTGATRQAFVNLVGDAHRPGRPMQWTRQRLAEVATVYSTAHAGGHSPVKAVENYYGISRALASKLVHRCRLSGLLPPTTAGKAKGGTPT